MTKHKKMSLECYNCNGKLKNGQVRIHGTLGGFMLVGLSYENLYFKSDSDKEIKILSSYGTTPAMRCENCGIVILNKEIIEHSEQSPREVLIEIFTVSSSKELQESLKESNPDINIHEAIIRAWNEFYFPEKNKFTESFTNEELKFLSEFNDLIVSENWKEIEIYADKKIGSIVNK